MIEHAIPEICAARSNSSKVEARRLDQTTPSADTEESEGRFLETEFTYNSDGIEGNSLTLRETQLVIEEGQTIRGKSLKEVFEAKNHPEMIGYVEALAGESGT